MKRAVCAEVGWAEVVAKLQAVHHVPQQWLSSCHRQAGQVGFLVKVRQLLHGGRRLGKLDLQPKSVSCLPHRVASCSAGVPCHLACKVNPEALIYMHRSKSGTSACSPFWHACWDSSLQDLELS